MYMHITQTSAPSVYLLQALKRRDDDFSELEQRASHRDDDFSELEQRASRHDDDFSELEQRARHASRVIYNRVPKCASEATLRILQLVGHIYNSYHYIHSMIFRHNHPPPQGIAELLSALNATHAPWVFDRHLHFVDFTAHGMPFAPLYINIVRKPLDRFISDYYFIRFGHPQPMPSQTRRMTFDQCVLSNHSECLGKQAFEIIPYFCGQSDVCLTPSRQALELAKHNVIKHFSVVGLQDNLLHTFALLEQTSPDLFGNLTRFAHRFIQHSGGETNKAKRHYPAGERAKLRMNERLTYENEFYEFVKKRFLTMQLYFKTDIFVKEVLAEKMNNRDSKAFAKKY